MNQSCEIADEIDVPRGTPPKLTKGQARAAFRESEAAKDECSVFRTYREIRPCIFLADREQLVYENGQLQIFIDRRGGVVFKIAGPMPASTTIPQDAIGSLEKYFEFLDFMT